jgi:hypothetical protein
MTVQEAVELVEKRLEGEKIGDIYLVADGSRATECDGWIRVPVRPSEEPRRIVYFYALLADINVEIMDETGAQIILTAGDPLVFPEEEAAPATRTAA